MNRQQRLTELLDFIEKHRDKESNFSVIYNRMVEEEALETSRLNNLTDNPYLNELKKIREKQASAYLIITNCDSKSNHWSEFKDFIRHFEMVVREALSSSDIEST